MMSVAVIVDSNRLLHKCPRGIIFAWIWGRMFFDYPVRGRLAISGEIPGVTNVQGAPLESSG